MIKITGDFYRKKAGDDDAVSDVEDWTDDEASAVQHEKVCRYFLQLFNFYRAAFYFFSLSLLAVESTDLCGDSGGDRHRSTIIHLSCIQLKKL